MSSDKGKIPEIKCGEPYHIPTTPDPETGKPRDYTGITDDFEYYYAYDRKWKIKNDEWRTPKKSDILVEKAAELDAAVNGHNAAGMQGDSDLQIIQKAHAKFILENCLENFDFEEIWNSGLLTRAAIFRMTGEIYSFLVGAGSKDEALLLRRRRNGHT